MGADGGCRRRARPGRRRRDTAPQPRLQNPPESTIGRGRDTIAAREVGLEWRVVSPIGAGKTENA